MDAILNINKPPGMTSFDVVARVKRLSGEKRVGHAGTLDPEATGVLPVCLGQATRIMEFLTNSTKTYLARIELGAATDTYDASGRITQRGDLSGISREQLTAALNSFLGTIPQTPPMYSAIKHQGKPLYILARAGISIERESRLVEVYRIQLTDWQPPLATIEVDCGKGTYIRSLAHDLGQMLGCGAFLKRLARLRCGIFGIDSAISLPALEDAFRCGYWQDFAYPLDVALLNWPAMIVGNATGQAIRNGIPVSIGGAVEPAPQSLCRAYTLEGDFIAVLSFDPEKKQWQPKKVFK